MSQALDYHRRSLAQMLAGSFVTVLVAPPFLSINLDYRSFLPALIPCLSLAVIWLYVSWRKMSRARAATEVAAAAILFALQLLILTYAAMRYNLPLMDGWLDKADRAIGFDGLAFVQRIDGNAPLSILLGYAYSSFSLQLVLLPALLCGLGYCTRGYCTVVAFIVIGVVSAVLSAFFPAIGAFAYHQMNVGSLQNINDMFGYHFLPSFHAVREDPTYTLSLMSASGIVTFPSVHAAAAVLCGWAGFAVRGLRWPILVLNVGMWLSTLTHGAHYLVDVLAGTVIAIGSIWIVRYRSGVLYSRCVSNPAAPATAALGR